MIKKPESQSDESYSSMKQETLTFEETSIAKKPKRKQSGEVSSSALLSSHTGDNSDLFPRILDLHVAVGSRIADVTYSKGVFWRNVDVTRYTFFPSDIKTGVDARQLPYDDNSLDAVVFDPPYMEGLLRTVDTELAGSGSHASFRNYYSDGNGQKNETYKYHDRVIDLYMLSAVEARRVLRSGGIYIVKCQDEVSANRQKLTHVELIYGYERLGFYCKDLFVITRSNKPVVSRMIKQEHARKNHSYFLVFVSCKGQKMPYSNFRKMLDSYQVDDI